MVEPEFNPFRELIDQMQDGVYFVSPDRTITFWSRGAERITGYRREDVVGRRCQDDVLCHVDCSGKSLCKDMCPLAHSIQDRQPRAAEVFLKHRDGHRVPVNVRTAPFVNSDGLVIGGVEIFNPAISRHADIERIRQLESVAFVDSLTELPNRRFATSKVAARITESAHSFVPWSLLMIDIDYFKRVNDTHGHPAGDRVLQALARTINAQTNPADIAARWGGEEFILVLNADLDQAMARAETLRAMVQCTTVELPDGSSLKVTVSIGVTAARPDDTLETIFNRADRHLYQAKIDGRNRVRLGRRKGDTARSNRHCR